MVNKSLSKTALCGLILSVVALFSFGQAQENSYFGVGAGSGVTLYYGTDDSPLAEEVRYALSLIPFGGLGVTGQVDFISSLNSGSENVDTYWGYGLNGYYFGASGVSAFGIGGGVLVGADFIIDETISIFADIGVGVNVGGVSAFGLDLGLPIAPAGRGGLGIKFKM